MAYSTLNVIESGMMEDEEGPEGWDPRKWSRRWEAEQHWSHVRQREGQLY